MGLKHANVKTTGYELIHDMPMIVPTTIAFEPEARLRWRLTMANWIVYFMDCRRYTSIEDKIFLALTWHGTCTDSMGLDLKA